MRIALIHRFGGTSKDIWFPWFAEQMADHELIMPDMPDTEHPDQDKWVEAIGAVLPDIQDAVLVGHSLGGTALLRFLERQSIESGVAKALILVATPADSVGIEEIESFFTKPFQWDRVREHTEQTTVIQSDDDPRVPMEHAFTIAGHLNAMVMELSGRGHIKQDDFPELVQCIKKLQ